jgi:hypothetical protein
MARLPEFTGREYDYGADPVMFRTLDGHIEPYKITRKASDDQGVDLSNAHPWSGTDDGA